MLVTKVLVICSTSSGTCTLILSSKLYVSGYETLDIVPMYVRQNTVYGPTFTDAPRSDVKEVIILSDDRAEVVIHVAIKSVTALKIRLSVLP
ncbi:hypothetical protein MPTK1_7g16040 [Marchantia polymorpha subsp. ruderalis]|uniref:Uncharacterized protein n=2 Tax=Marchantia polymorpha TaxID=3197 RepID=A0AAF6C065_MARPO|nr:hypothetical protein MARPO_0111s0016 [Marchantia polymorpha]BBN17649.1 hypothetical protein Mp_7g16040 [Marchantia polymorpha subsp. ruderalis]|eukprot:PTQ31455.1 hypothetical protein MARPO_0111s0016 [Marchantia polymorpha]